MLEGMGSSLQNTSNNQSTPSVFNMAFNGEYQQLAAALIAQHGVAAAAAVPPPPSEPIAKYGGDRMDVERMESHVAKWLSDNCVDTNATVLQNVRLFMDHVSNVYKDKVATFLSDEKLRNLRIIR